MDVGEDLHLCPTVILLVSNVRARACPPTVRETAGRDGRCLEIVGLFSIVVRSRFSAQLSHFEQWSLMDKQSRESQPLRKPQQAHQAYWIPSLSTFKTQHHRISAIQSNPEFLLSVSLTNHGLNF